jgi:Flp pilus assembly protein TadD
MTDNALQLVAAKVELAGSRYRNALGLLERITACSAEEEAQKLVLLGESFEGLNDAARAHDSYAQAQSIAPAFAVPILREGVLRYYRGDLEGARILLYRYVDRESGNPEAYYYLALCERDPLRKAALVRKVAILDGPTGAWSKELLQSLAQWDTQRGQTP